MICPRMGHGLFFCPNHPWLRYFVFGVMASKPMVLILWGCVKSVRDLHGLPGIGIGPIWVRFLWVGLGNYKGLFFG